MDGCRGEVRNARSISVSRSFVRGLSDSAGRGLAATGHQLIHLGAIRPASPTQAGVRAREKRSFGSFRESGNVSRQAGFTPAAEKGAPAPKEACMIRRAVTLIIPA